MTLDMQSGKRAKRIWWSNTHGDSQREAVGSRTLTYEHEYRGDHGLDFIVERDGDRVVFHHNLVCIATVEWAEP